MNDYVEIAESLIFVTMGLLSVLAVAVFAERLIYYGKSVNQKADDFFFLIRNSLHQLTNINCESLEKADHIYFRFVSYALERLEQGKKGLSESLEAQILTEKISLETRIPILNTLGNNAPFIGLLGTVLGVIKAFYGLGSLGSAGAEVVMRSISTALLATAAGLAIAIPVVMANNYFSRKSKVILQNLEILRKDFSSFEKNSEKMGAI